MRLAMTFLVFLMASVTIAGSILVVALAAPELGFAQLDTIWIPAAAGFALALPVSYVLAGRILRGLKRD
ncbi:MAG: hypothetical protein AAFR16_10505 [Pseudomonadota bacterium]